MLPYTEVLFHPELLQRVKSQSGSMSSNPLLEFCLDGGQVKWDKEDSRGEQAVLEAAHPRHPLLHPILEICARSQFTFHDLKTLETLVRGCRDFSSPSLGCDIHALDLDGNSAMHLLVKNCSRESFPFVLRGISILLSRPCHVAGLVNCHGNTVLHQLHSLFAKDMFPQAFEILRVLLGSMPEDQCPAFINLLNTANRSILSLAVEHGDVARDLIRFLLNFGAQVCPIKVGECHGDIGLHLVKERECSSFTWLLRYQMQNGHPDHVLLGEEVLSLVGHAMASDPVWMRDHVHRVMMSLGHSANPTLGSLFAVVKSRLEALWNQPQSLRYLSSQQVRQSLRPKTLSDLRVLQHHFTHIPVGILRLLQMD